MIFPDFFIGMFLPRVYGCCPQRLLACVIQRLQFDCLYLRHPGISKLGHQPGLLILGGAACIWRPSLGSAGDLHEDSKSVTQTPRQASLSYSGYSHRWPRVWQGLPRLSWADYLPVCHPTVVTVVVTSLLYSSAAAPIPALGLKACCLCKANKPLQSLEPVLGTQIRWLLPCHCHHCRLLTRSARVVLPPLCPLFPGYLLQFSPVLGSQPAPFCPESCPAHACCLAGLAAHMGSRGKGLGYFCDCSLPGRQLEKVYCVPVLTQGFGASQ